jgi:hypothetical protein
MTSKPRTLQQFAQEMLLLETYPQVDIFKFNLGLGRYVSDTTYATLINNEFEHVRLKKPQIKKIQSLVDEYLDLLIQLDTRSAKKCIMSRQPLEKLATGSL